VQALTELLSEPPIGPAFGARDVWQVIDQVNANELGGAVNVARTTRRRRRAPPF